MEILTKIYKEINENKNYFSITQTFDIDTYKRFSELSIFFELTSLLCDYTKVEKNSTLGEFLFLEINNIPENIIFKNLYATYHIVVPYVSIRKYKRIEKYEKYLEVVSDNKLFPPETTPHRSMEWDYMLYKLDSNYNVPIPQNSILEQDFYPQFFDRELAYSLTHALFYLTDFGFASRRPQISNFAKLKFQLESLIAKFFENNDIDVLLELGINYFSLLPYLELDYNVLIIINYALYKAKFIEFNWSKEVLEKKHHSFFVLGILVTLIHHHLNNNMISNAKKEALLLKIKNTVFSNEEDDSCLICSKEEIESLSIINSWEIIKKTKNKEFSVELFQNYIDNHDKNPLLTQNILSYLQILKWRNEQNILWTLEFNELNISEVDQLIMKEKYQFKIENEIKYLKTLQ